MDFIDFVDPDEESRPKVDKCKGLVFRASVTQWCNCKGIGQTVRLKLLKRQSCTGCEYCGYYSEFFNETEDELYLGDLEHGKIYSIDFETSQDWESGHTEVEGIIFNGGNYE